MKTLFALMTVFSLSQAFAQVDSELVPGDLRISAASGEIVSINPICPPQAPGRVSCMAYGSSVVVKVSLNGCMDRLGGYSSKLEIQNGKGILYFSAINIVNEASERVRCAKRNTKIVRVPVVYQGDIKLVNLDFNGSKF